MNHVRNKLRAIAVLQDRRSVEVHGHRIGKLLRWDDHGPLVDFPNNPHGPLTARSTTSVSRPVDPDKDHDVLLVFEGERSNHPIVIALLTPAGRPNVPALGESMNAVVDGKKVVLRGTDRIDLECGPARISLTSDGRVVIRGVAVETRAEQVNRIKGGSVQIN